MIKDGKELDKRHPKPILDLRGPEGNAFVVLGYARQYGRQMGWEEEEINNVIKDMQSGDYEHLITVFDKHFGELVDIYR